MWEDKILYWAWRSKDKVTVDPPSEKVIKYEVFVSRHKAKLHQKLAVGVWDLYEDRAVYTPINQEECQQLSERTLCSGKPNSDIEYPLTNKDNNDE